MANKNKLVVTDTSFYGRIDDNTPQDKAKTEEVKNILETLNKRLAEIEEQFKDVSVSDIILKSLLSQGNIDSTMQKLKDILNVEIDDTNNTKEELDEYEEILAAFRPEEWVWWTCICEEDGTETELTSDDMSWRQARYIGEILIEHGINVKLKCYYNGYGIEFHYITATWDDRKQDWVYKVESKEA